MYMYTHTHALERLQQISSYLKEIYSTNNHSDNEA